MRIVEGITPIQKVIIRKLHLVPMHFKGRIWWLLLCVEIVSSFHRPGLHSIRRNLALADEKKGIFNFVSRFFRRNDNNDGKSAQKALKFSQEVQNIISKEVIIIGAGASGLSCANELYKCGVKDILLLEASDDVGGRIRTDEVDGFLLDRGFQVFITKYPLAQRSFDYASLDLQNFNPGALVHFQNEFHTVSDPFRRPQDLLPSLISPIGSLTDKIIVGILSILIQFNSVSNIISSEEKNTLTFLKEKGISDAMITRFFTPFFQGIFLSSLESQSSRMFEFVFKMFSEGEEY